MNGVRRVGAVGTGILQVIVGLVLAFLSIESIGLVSDDEFALSWPLAIPSFCLLGTIGITVSFASGHLRWLRVGASSAALAFVVALVASIAIGSVAAGALIFAVVQFLPAVLPSRFAADGMHARLIRETRRDAARG
jgi:hypothetical protein